MVLHLDNNCKTATRLQLLPACPCCGPGAHYARCVLPQIWKKNIKAGSSLRLAPQRFQTCQSGLGALGLWGEGHSALLALATLAELHTVRYDPRDLPAISLRWLLMALVNEHHLHRNGLFFSSALPIQSAPTRHEGPRVVLRHKLCYVGRR